MSLDAQSADSGEPAEEEAENISKVTWLLLFMSSSVLDGMQIPVFCEGKRHISNTCTFIYNFDTVLQSSNALQLSPNPNIYLHSEQINIRKCCQIEFSFAVNN